VGNQSREKEGRKKLKRECEEAKRFERSNFSLSLPSRLWLNLAFSFSSLAF
jgi:hypothetical protein